MTTIAYCDGLMACDSSHINHADMREALMSKIVRLSSGGLLGGAGDSYDQQLIKLFDNVTEPSQFPSKKKLMKLGLDYDGLLVLPDGKVYRIVAHPRKHSLNCVDELNRGVCAAGTGAMIAIGSMLEKHDPKRAVELACEWDPYSSLPVHTMKLDQSNKK